MKTIGVAFFVVAMVVGCSTGGGPDGAEGFEISIPPAPMLDEYTDYQLNPGLDLVFGEQSGWAWKAPSEKEVLAQAELLGVEKHLTSVAPESGGGWRTDESSQEVLLEVSRDGNWTAQPAVGPVTQKDIQDCVDAAAQDGGSADAAALQKCVDQISQQQENYLAPAYSDAEVAAKMLFPKGSVFAPGELNEEVTTVVVSRPVAEQFSIEIGYYQAYASPPQGPVGWVAGGRVGVLEDLGPLKTMSAKKALSRIGDYRFGYEIIADGLPYEIPETVTMVSVSPALVRMYDADGGMFWLPGFAYGDSAGNAWHVVAVEDEYFADKVTQDSFEQTKDIPDTFLQDLNGLFEQQAVEKISSIGLYARVVSRNGEELAASKDYRPDRVNITIENDVVVKAEVY